MANWSVVEFAHVAAKHWVPAGGKEQLSDELSQRPPQMVSVEPAHAARPPTGWPEKIETVSVANLLAATIHNIHHSQSVSVLFED